MSKSENMMTHSEVAGLLEGAWLKEGRDPAKLGVLIGAVCSCGCMRRLVGVADKDSGETQQEMLSALREPATCAQVSALVRRLLKPARGELLPVPVPYRAH